MRDTIFALATAPGRSALAVVRVSGPECLHILKRLDLGSVKPRQASLRKLVAPSGELIDEGLVLWFPGPNSFTGEDVFELQLHGGRAVVEGALQMLAQLGARPAEPGEFTRRAFEAGRLELSQAEAVADLVDAETDAQRRQALAQLGGALARRGESWRETLLSALAFLEAQIDFPDEDVPPDVAAEARAPLLELKRDLERALADVRGERIRDGLRIALIGAPNAGKSSLLNALLCRDAAIVTPVAGTTRDVIEAPLIVAGYKVLLADTAGLRDTSDEVEIEGVRRAKSWAAGADLRLWLVDPSDETASWKPARDLIQPADALVATKSDQGSSTFTVEALAQDLHLSFLKTSAIETDGVASVRVFIEGWVVERLSGSDFPAVTRARHRSMLESALDHLRRAIERPTTDAELIAEDVRLAARDLERLSGRVDPEAVLDRVFASFCIGK